MDSQHEVTELEHEDEYEYIDLPEPVDPELIDGRRPSTSGQPGLIAVDPNQAHGEPVWSSPATTWNEHDEQPEKEVLPEQDNPYGSNLAFKTREGYEVASQLDEGTDTINEKRRGRRICGLPILLCLSLVAIVALILAISLGVGLGVGLKKKSTNTKSYLSRIGALNGTGFGLGTTVVNDQDGQIELFFQHHSGDIRYLVRNNDGSWTGGDKSHIVATDAKNKTIMSIVTYTFNNTATWHLFYTDNQNVLKQRTRTTPGDVWQDGPLNNLHISPMNDPNLAFGVCYDSYVAPNLPDGTLGMQLFYASDSKTIQEVNWVLGQNSWTPQGSFTANGHAGLGCYTWGTSTVHYVMFVDLNNNLKVMWKDANTTAATATHPVNQWVNTTVSLAGVNPVTPISYNEFLIVQMQDMSLTGFNITFDGENTKLSTSGQFQLDQKPINGTHIWLWDLPTASGDQQLTVFDQVNGTDITMTERDMVTGQVSIQELPIPNN